MLDAQARILIFAKAPILGQVKTRLIPAIGPRGAVWVQRLLLENALSSVGGAALCPAQCWCWPTVDHPAFKSWVGHPRVSFHLQPEGDLGAKMRIAAEQALTRAERVLLIGVDCPVLDAGILSDALRLLAQQDAVIGPAEDGGYVLLGLRRAERSLFDNMPWGCAGVLEETRRRMGRLGWKWAELSPLWDVDRKEDLERLRGLDDKWARRLARLTAAE